MFCWGATGGPDAPTRTLCRRSRPRQSDPVTKTDMDHHLLKTAHDEPRRFGAAWTQWHRDPRWFRGCARAAGWRNPMRAAFCTAYGPPEVLQIRTVPDPRPRNSEVCIRLFATSVTASDCLVRGLKLRGRYRLFMRVAFGWRAPRKQVIGMIASGRIESVGRDVKSFKEGDDVFGMDGFRAGTYAEKVCWPATTQLALKPSNLNFEEASALPYGGLLASYFTRRLRVGAGQR